MTATRVEQLKRDTFRNPIVLCATGFGMGWFPWAPGTLASIVALLIWWVFLSGQSAWVQILVVAVFCFFTLAILGLFTRRYGEQDFQFIVIDEILGMWLACLLLPPVWLLMLAVFVGFRFLDIVKPWPISWIDRNVKGSIGIALDDLVAGGLTCVLAHGLWIILTYFNT